MVCRYCTRYCIAGRYVGAIAAYVVVATADAIVLLLLLLLLLLLAFHSVLTVGSLPRSSMHVPVRVLFFTSSVGAFGKVLRTRIPVLSAFS